VEDSGFARHRAPSRARASSGCVKFQRDCKRSSIVRVRVSSTRRRAISSDCSLMTRSSAAASPLRRLLELDERPSLSLATPRKLRFIRSRKSLYGPDFAQLIRLSKWWKRTRAISDSGFRFKSFMIELLWAHLADEGLALADYPTSLERFFTYIVRTELTDQVAFTDYNAASDIPSRSSAAIEVLDPVNLDNNVAVRYDHTDRTRIVDAAQEALSALGEARFATTKGRALDCWRSVMGPSFEG
jgi:hypothetical protein